eukprot:TRINITY_DN34388_c0_g1_i1.p1 TRINITY_DN34388_c0_g1~~TRINITY_DN34388_c0_g1_i1.p1  ORF type:complete len:604 (+),score=24.68 TRINITY_DN34388_c0_g1_i1:80-1813(+)
MTTSKNKYDSTRWSVYQWLTASHEDFTDAVEWAASKCDLHTVLIKPDPSFVSLRHKLSILHMAVLRHDLAAVAQLLHKFHFNPHIRPDFNAMSPQETAALVLRPAAELMYKAVPSWQFENRLEDLAFRGEHAQLLQEAEKEHTESDIGFTVHFAAARNAIDCLEVSLRLCEQIAITNGIDLVPVGQRICPEMRVTPLHCAAANGCIEAANWLLQHGAAITSTDSLGNTPLIWAARHGHLSAVKWAAEVGARIDEGNLRGNTAALTASLHGHLDVVQWLLLEGGAKLSDKNKQGRTVVVAAAVRGQLKILQWLAQQFGDQIDFNAGDIDGNTPLLMAAYWNKLDVLQWLVEHRRVHLDQRNGKGNTAVLRAAWNGNTVMVKWLVDVAGAELEGDVNVFGRNVVMVAAENGHLDLVKYLLEEKSMEAHCTDKCENNILSIAARFGQLHIVQYLLAKYGKCIIKKDEYGRDIVRYTAANQHYKVVKWLILSSWDSVYSLPGNVCEKCRLTYLVQSKWTPRHHHDWPVLFQAFVGFVVWSIQVQHTLYIPVELAFLLIGFLPSSVMFFSGARPNLTHCVLD